MYDDPRLIKFLGDSHDYLYYEEDQLTLFLKECSNGYPNLEPKITQVGENSEKVPVKKFNMGRWGFFKENKKEHTVECLTAACAVGHACFDPGFRRVGLHYIDYGYKLEPTFEGYTNYGAAKRFFGLATTNEAEYLFSPSRYWPNDRPTPKQVAKRIEDFVLNRRKLQCAN